MKRAKSGRGRSIEIGLKFWYDADHGVIHLRGEGSPASFLSTVSPNPKHERGHPHLFKHLAKALRAAGAPAPDAE